MMYTCRSSCHNNNVINSQSQMLSVQNWQWQWTTCHNPPPLHPHQTHSLLFSLSLLFLHLLSSPFGRRLLFFAFITVSIVVCYRRHQYSYFVNRWSLLLCCRLHLRLLRSHIKKKKRRGCHYLPSSLFLSPFTATAINGCFTRRSPLLRCRLQSVAPSSSSPTALITHGKESEKGKRISLVGIEGVVPHCEFSLTVLYSEYLTLIIYYVSNMS